MELQDLPPTPVKPLRKLPFSIKVTLLILCILAALPFLIKFIYLKQPMGSQDSISEMSITTTRLGLAVVNKSYTSKISGHVSTSNTSLRFTPLNLPAGLAVGNCVTRSENGTTLDCEITGTPKAPGGNFPVRFVLTGQSSTTTEKTLNLVVINLSF